MWILGATGSLLPALPGRTGGPAQYCPGFFYAGSRAAVQGQDLVAAESFLHPRVRQIKKRKRKKPLAVSGPQWPETLVGGKYIRMLERHLHARRAAAAHGNRQLFYEDVLIAHLLAFFNPTLRS